jgi:nucleotide-binding universal stress UspA family protein
MSESFGHTTKPVLACLDGGDDGDRALRYAIEEAQRRKTGVRLLHVPPDVIPYAPMVPLYSTPSLRDIGAHILKDALDLCLELVPDLYVEGTLVTGPTVSGIVGESKDAAAVVLGTRQWKAHRVFGGSTSVGVATRAHCPVLLIPPVWMSGAPKGRVTVGVDGMAGPPVVLERAFAAARERRAGLVIVHAWTAPDPYAPAFGTFEPEQWRRATDASLAELTVGIRADYPDVKVEQIVTYGSDKSTVSDLAAGSELLVLGRHRHSAPLIHRLGSVAQHALHAGMSPLEIIPVHEA